MSRPLRLELAGALYHVTSRGDRREDIYFGDGDRLAWLDLFGRVCTRFNWVCHAWCQMTNHYHIVVETVEGNLAGGMRQLNGVYTQYINRTHARVGHVFQGRYKAILVEKDAYLLELARYVLLNPVRAGMVADTADWPWSSHAALTGAQSAPDWLERDWILGQFAGRRDLAIPLYLDFVRVDVGLPGLWGALKGQVYLGTERFIKDMQGLSNKAEINEIPRVQRRPLAKPLAHYRNSQKDMAVAMAQAYATGDYTLQEIAEFFGVHYTTVSRAVRKWEGLRECKT